MPDKSRPVPSTRKYIPYTPGPSRVEPLSEAELDLLFQPTQDYKTLRALAFACVLANTALSPSSILLLAVNEINRQQEILFSRGRPYRLITKPCTLFAWLDERRYRPGVHALFTDRWGRPMGRIEAIARHLPAIPARRGLIHPLRRVYWTRLPTGTR